MVTVQTILIGIVLALGARVVQEYRRTIHRDYVVHEHYPGKCSQVSGIENGSEDIALVPGTSFALITNGLRLVRTPNKPGGHIYIFDFSKPESGAHALQFVNYDKDAPFFSPHGLKIWPNLPTPAGNVPAASTAGSSQQHVQTTTYFVYVVNHHQNDTKDHVEKFEFDTGKPTQLKFVKSFTDSHFYGVVNSIAMVGEDKFYFTNFLPYFYLPIIGSIPPMETLLGAPLGSVGFCDGTTGGGGGRIVASGHLSPNGIAASHDLSTVYVADTHNGYLYTYVRGARGSGRKDDNGDLLIGTNPFGHGMWKFVPGLFDKRRLESAVLKLHVDQKTKIPTSTRELFNDNAKLLDGGSVAVTYGNGQAMLVGSVVDRLVYCECSVRC